VDFIERNFENLAAGELGDARPVDQVSSCREVVGAAVLVVEVVGVFSEVDAEDGGLGIHQWVVLVGSGDDFDAVAVEDESRSAAAEKFGCRVEEFLAEIFSGFEFFLDFFAEFLGGLGRGGGERFPEKTVVPVAAAVVADGWADGVGQHREGLKDFFEAGLGSLSVFEGGVEFGDVAAVVALVVDLHRLGVDGGGECVVAVGKFGELEHFGSEI